MVSFNTISSNNSANNLAKAAATQAATLARISSGNRIAKAADDVASLATGTALNTAVTALRSALGNASQGSSLLQVANGSLNQQLEILDRQKALTVQASSGQLNDTQRNALNQEFQGLSAQLNQLATGTNFNGVALLDGSTAQAGGNLNFTLGNGANDTISIALNDTSTATLFGGQAVDISSQSSAQTASAAVDAAITALTSTQASVGAFQSRFDAASNSITSAIQAQEEARSALLDSDIGSESTASAAARVQLQAAIATQAQTNKLSGGLLKLLG